MRTVRRLFYRDIVSSVGFVALAFLSLFFFIDFVEELGDVAKGYTLLHATAFSLLQMPGHLYELMPIAVLIGTIYALARLAQSSEYTILRTGGLGPGRALSLLAGLGLMFALATYVVGDWIAPFSERQATELQARAKGKLRIGSAGAWLKDRAVTPQGERSYSVNVGSAGVDGTLQDVRIFEFDADGRLVRRIGAATARIGDGDTWQLGDVKVTHWNGAAGDAQAVASEEKLPTLAWPSSLSAGVVAAAVLPLSTMSTVELFRYIGHLSDNEQAAQRHEIQFWKRALYPFACLVMMALALPFAYMHARAGGISFKVFSGIMLGIGFVLLNNMSGHLGLLRNWTPWITAAAPSALFLLFSLAAFSWLVRYR
jgi:lipopolysaccharide export system permease protein